MIRFIQHFRDTGFASALVSTREPESLLSLTAREKTRAWTNQEVKELVLNDTFCNRYSLYICNSVQCHALKIREMKFYFKNVRTRNKQQKQKWHQILLSDCQIHSPSSLLESILIVLEVSEGLGA